MVHRRAGQLQLELQQRHLICRIGRRMYAHGLIVACEGNLSVRLGKDRILVTPAGACKGDLAPSDLLVTDLSGSVVEGAGRPTSEMRMHLVFYNLRPGVAAVCHGHPPNATAFAAAGRALEQAVLPEVVVGLGRIPLAPYGTPGTREICTGLEPLAASYDAILLENHGVVTCGPDLTIAYQRLETVEHLARIILAAEALGGPRLLRRAEVQKLIAAREHYGVSSANGPSDLPLTFESSTSQRLALEDHPTGVKRVLQPDRERLQ